MALSAEPMERIDAQLRWSGERIRTSDILLPKMVRVNFIRDV
jgi:hypothetical protein